MCSGNAIPSISILSKMRNYITTLLVFFCFTALSAQCSWPDSVSNKFKLTVWKAVYEKGMTFSEPDIVNNAYLPTDSMKLILNLIGCVYNDTGSTHDSIFNVEFEYNHLRKYNSNIFELSFYTSGYQAYADSWYLGKKSSNTSLENLISYYKLKIKCYKYSGRYYGSLVGDSAMNTKYVADELNGASMTNNFIPEEMGFDGNFLTFRRNKDTQLLTFGFRWGDCLSGCMHYKYLTYKFVNGKKYGPFYKSNIPALPAGPHYLVPKNNKKTYWNCTVNQVRQYFPELYEPYNYYVGKPFGKWYINEVDKTDEFNKSGSILLTGTGTFYISHVPKDSLGVHYNDTLYVRYNALPTTPIFKRDSAYLCPDAYIGHNHDNEWQDILSQWVSDSVTKNTWKLQPVNSISPTDKFAVFRLRLINLSTGCSVENKLNYAARFYPAILTRLDTQWCAHSPVVVRPYYSPDAGVLNCNGKNNLTACAFYASPTNFISYTYLGCTVNETIKIAYQNTKRIAIPTSYSIQGFDSLVLDAGAGWKSVFWNSVPLGRKFTFKGTNTTRSDTLHLRCIDSNDCYDTLNLVINQSEVVSIQEANKEMIHIYPNPFSNEIQITGPRELRWELYSSQGVIMHKGMGTKLVPTADWVSGMYYFKTELGQHQTLVLIH